MKVPFLDLRDSYIELKPEIDSAVARVLDSGRYILGAEVEAFEAEFAEYCHVDHVVGVADGLDALHLALLALGIGPGDEVVVPSNTFIATWLAVSQCGATPVPVEPLDATCNLDPDATKAAITSRTKAIIPVHLYGQPADLDPILETARQCGLWVLEDAAQAHGARYKGRLIGGHGHLAAWSFYPGKNLGAMGDGGAVSTNDAALAEKLRELRNYGSKKKYVHDTRGFNSRLDPVQAAILRVKLKHLDEWNARRKAIALRYLQGLAGLGLSLPQVPEFADPSWHLFAVRHPRRTSLQDSLARAGIDCLIHYPIPPHRQGAYADVTWAEDAFPVASRISETTLSLPIGPQLSLEAVENVIGTVAMAIEHL